MAEEHGDRLTMPELMQMVAGLLPAGHETTTNLIAHTVVELAHHPTELARLRADPELRTGDAMGRMTWRAGLSVASRRSFSYTGISRSPRLCIRRSLRADPRTLTRRVASSVAGGMRPSHSACATSAFIVQLESGGHVGPGFAQEHLPSGKVDDEHAIGVGQPESGHQPGSCSNVGERLVGDNVFEQSPEVTVDLVGIAEYGHH